MIRIVLEVDAPPGCVIGVKESVSMAAEPYGNIRVVSVEGHEGYGLLDYRRQTSWQSSRRSLSPGRW